MKIWLVSLTIEVEAEDEENAVKEANAVDNTAIVSSAIEIGEYDNG